MRKPSQSERYYDAFAAGYERQRHRGYHRMLDDLEVSIVERHCTGRMLEAGCGTGLILERLTTIDGRSHGVDLSAGMLSQARRRGLSVSQADLVALPFPDQTFDSVVSFKVLAHVDDLPRALQELDRVTKSGGVLALEFYNRHSLRYAIKRLKTPQAIADDFTDHDVLTRYHRLQDIRALLPRGLVIEEIYGIRILTPIAAVHDLPLVGSALRWIEGRLARQRWTRLLGGFLVVVLRKS